MPMPIPQPAWQSRSLGPALALVAAALLCYANSLHNGFVFDDSAYVGSPPIQQFAAGRLLFENWLNLDLYRPLALLSIALDHHLYGTAPFGYHLTNLLLHIANSLLFHRLGLRLLARPAAALAAALLYSVHPLQTEVVNWVSARGDLLLGLFLLSGLLCHCRGAPQSSPRHWRILAGGCFAAALLAKESGVMWIGMVWWWDCCPRGRLEGIWGFSLRWLRRHWGYLLVLGLWLLLRGAVLSTGEPSARPVSANFLAGTPLAQRLLTLGSIFLRYLVLLVFPMRLCADYSYNSIPLVASPLDPWFLSGLGIALLLAGLPLYLSSPALAFAAGLFWLGLLPVANLFFLPPSAMAERYLYLALPALCLGLGLALDSWLERPPAQRRAGLAVLLVALLCCGARTIQRNLDWRSNRTLFTAVLALYPGNARAHENLGFAAYQGGQPSEAIAQYKMALAIRPQNVRVHCDLGIIYSQLDRLDEATAAFRAALRLNPNHAHSYYGLGLVHHKLGQFQTAIHYYQEALRLAPDHRDAAQGLASLKRR